MATVQTERGGVVGVVARVTGFLSAVNVEIRKITWPTRDDLVDTTRKIILLAAALGVVIGLFDWILQKILVDGVAALAR